MTGVKEYICLHFGSEEARTTMAELEEWCEKDAQPCYIKILRRLFRKFYNCCWPRATAISSRPSKRSYRAARRRTATATWYTSRQVPLRRRRWWCSRELTSSRLDFTTNARCSATRPIPSTGRTADVPRSPDCACHRTRMRPSLRAITAGCACPVTCLHISYPDPGSRATWGTISRTTRRPSAISTNAKRSPRVWFPKRTTIARRSLLRSSRWAIPEKSVSRTLRIWTLNHPFLKRYILTSSAGFLGLKSAGALGFFLRRRGVCI